MAADNPHTCSGGIVLSAKHWSRFDGRHANEPPYALLAAAGLRFAPAHDQAALNPGFMPLFVALIAAIALGESVVATRRIGLALILVGALVIVGWHAAVWSTSRTFGHTLFLSAAFLWACFTVVMRRANLDPLRATALSALFAMPLLGEWPSATDWLGIALISAGVYLASGGPVPTRCSAPPASTGRSLGS